VTVGGRWKKRTAVETAKAVLSGELGIIEGSVRLSALSHGIVPVWHEDKDFLVFGVLASDTDHLPTGSARQYWSSAALAREDQNIARIEASAEANVIAACKNIIARFETNEEETE
jgi:hypothetical protein